MARIRQLPHGLYGIQAEPPIQYRAIRPDGTLLEYYTASRPLMLDAPLERDQALVVGDYEWQQLVDERWETVARWHVD